MLRLGREQTFAVLHDYYSALADLASEGMAFFCMLGFAACAGTSMLACLGLIFTPPTQPLVACAAHHPLVLVAQAFGFLVGVTAGSSQLRAHFGIGTRSAQSLYFSFLTFELGVLSPLATPRATMLEKITMIGPGCAMDQAMGSEGSHLPALVRLSVVVFGMVRLVNIGMAVLAFVLRRMQQLFCVAANALTRITTLVEFALLLALIVSFVWRLASYVAETLVFFVAVTDEVVSRTVCVVYYTYAKGSLPPFAGSSLGPNVRFSQFPSALSVTFETGFMGMLLGLVFTGLFALHLVLLHMKHTR